MKKGNLARILTQLQQHLDSLGSRNGFVFFHFSKASLLGLENKFTGIQDQAVLNY